MHDLSVLQYYFRLITPKKEILEGHAVWGLGLPLAWPYSILRGFRFSGFFVAATVSTLCWPSCMLQSLIRRRRKNKARETLNP